MSPEHDLYTPSLSSFSIHSCNVAKHPTSITTNIISAKLLVLMCINIDRARAGGWVYAGKHKYINNCVSVLLCKGLSCRVFKIQRSCQGRTHCLPLSWQRARLVVPGVLHQKTSFRSPLLRSPLPLSRSLYLGYLAIKLSLLFTELSQFISFVF